MRRTTRRSFMGQATLLGLGLGSTAWAADKPKALTVLLFGGELPEVLKELEKDYEITILRAGVKKGSKKGEVEGLEQLKKADVFLYAAQKRVNPSKEQLEYFQTFHKAGKPIIGLRAASHLFQNWLVIDKEVFGAKYGGHHLSETDPNLKLEIARDAADHPILKGLTPPSPVSGSYIYTELAPDVKVLLESGLPGDMQPHTWIRENKKTGGRVFYTRYDAKEMASNKGCREILARGFAWAVGRDKK
jgi:hypothetical protein